MKLFNFISVLVCLFASGFCGRIHFSDCGSSYDLKSLSIDGCTYLPCPLLMESSVNVSIGLTARHSAKKVTQEIVIQTKMINFQTTSNPEPCTSERRCPISPGDASFTTRLWVPDIAPFTSKLTWRMRDEDGVLLMCFYTDVHLCEVNDTDPLCYQ